MPPQADYIEADPRQAYPWARGFLLLVWPYVPYTPESGLSGYYPASNQSYHAAMGLRQKLLGRGERCEMARVPFKTVMEHWGLGTMLCNSLIALPRWGTRFILQGLMVEAEGECPDPVLSSGCLHCGRCQRACPGGAIDEGGYHWRRCIRAYMEEDMPPAVMERMTVLMGCEVCQEVCPLNAGVPHRPQTGEERAAFAPERLLAGEQKTALQIIGKNMKKGNKLIAQSAVLAAKAGRKDLLPLMEQQLKEQIPNGERQALLWAISRLQRPKE